ncbi:hypothetical protein JCM8547_004546 [Rhodosporidiobolus lusitaniae]
MDQAIASTSASTENSPADVPVAPTPKGKKRAAEDEGEGGGEGGEGGEGGKKRRHRKPVTCAQCRKRKLKCDRGYPCGACRDRQEGHLCEWEGAIRLPQPHLTRDAEAQELRLQLDRLENLLGALGGNPAAMAAAAAANVPGAGGATPSGSGTAEKRAAEALGLLAANPAASVLGTPRAAASAHRAQLLAAAPTVSHLVTLLPAKKELEKLVNRFLVSEILFFPIVHVPTFTKRLKEFTNAAAPEQPFFLALLFAIGSFEMVWQLTEPRLNRAAGVEKEHAAKRFFEAASEALRMGGFMEAPDLDVLRALLVLYRCAEQQLDPRGSYYLTQAVQIAQSLGLNRDPASIGCFNHIEVEERRKLWHILVGLDWLDNSNRLSVVTTSQYDTREPSNAFDNDITETSVSTKPFPTFTPWLFTHLQNQISVYSNAISQDVYAVKPHAPLSWDRIEQLNAGLEGLKRKLPVLDWTGDFVKPLGEENVESDRFRVQAHSILLELVIRLNRPFLTRGLAEPRMKEGREKCIDAAHKLIGIWLGYSEKNAIPRLPSVMFNALSALLLCAIDLFQDRTGPYADKHRRLIAGVTHKLNGREYRSKIVMEINRVLGVLIRAAAKPSESRRGSMSSDNSLAALLPTMTFVRPFPLPMTLDSFALSTLPAAAPSDDPELVGLFDTLVAHFKQIYTVPDRQEWQELVKVGSAPWSQGVDLVTPVVVFEGENGIAVGGASQA